MLNADCFPEPFPPNPPRYQTGGAMPWIGKAVCFFGVAVAATGSVRESTERTLALLEKTAAEWKVPCPSCHHQSLAMIALDSARRHGLGVDEPAAQVHVAKTL